MQLIYGKKNNWLLGWALINLCLAFVIMLFVGAQPYEGSRNPSNYPLIATVITMLFLAPILEELLFRSFFSSNKLKFIGITCLPIFIYFVGEAIHTYILLIIFYVTYFLGYGKPKSVSHKFSLVFSALLFAVVHYKTTDFLRFETAYYVLFQFANGLLLIWLTINLTLGKAVVFHICWNAIIVTILLVALQFPDQTIHKYESEVMNVEWQRKPYFDNNSSYNDDGQSISVIDMQPSILYKILYRKQRSDTLVYDREPFMLYNIRFTSRDSTNNPAFRDEIDKFLQKEMIYFLEK